MEKACSNFRNCIGHDDLIACKLYALWSTMQHWRPNGKKFTSFLYQKTVWECLKAVNKKVKDRHKNIPIEKATKNRIDIHELLEILPPELKDIVYKRYVEQMTLREISEIYQCCHETIRRKIMKAIKILRKNHKVGYNSIGTGL